jgi:hypothetical protein
MITLLYLIMISIMGLKSFGVKLPHISKCFQFVTRDNITYVKLGANAFCIFTITLFEIVAP